LAEHYQADQHVTRNGPTGNGCSWQYDKKTHRYGILYDDGSFYPADDQKQSDQHASQPNKSGGPSDFDRILDKNMGEIRQASAQADKQFAGFVKLLFGAVIGYAAGKTFASALDKDPDNVSGAAQKALRTVACGNGIAGVVFALCILTLIILFTAQLWGPVAATVIKLLYLFGLYSIYGLIRVSKGKSFWIGFGKAPSFRAIQLPKIAYVGIELLVTALLTKPILMWINSFTIEWAQANQDTVSNSLVLLLGLGMLLVSIALAAAVGLLVCKLVKWITGATGA